MFRDLKPVTFPREGLVAWEGPNSISPLQTRLAVIRARYSQHRGAKGAKFGCMVQWGGGETKTPCALVPCVCRGCSCPAALCGEKPSSSWTQRGVSSFVQAAEGPGGKLVPG